MNRPRYQGADSCIRMTFNVPIEMYKKLVIIAHETGNTRQAIARDCMYRIISQDFDDILRMNVKNRDALKDIKLERQPSKRHIKLTEHGEYLYDDNEDESN